MMRTPALATRETNDGAAYKRETVGSLPSIPVASPNQSDCMPSTNSLKLIERRIKELQTRAERIRKNEQEGMDQLRAVIEKYKLAPAHLKMALGSMGAQRSTRPRPSVKAAPKYRSLENAAVVWSGRGRKPSWLVAGLKSGRTMEEFLIRENPEEASDPTSAAE